MVSGLDRFESSSLVERCNLDRRNQAGVSSRSGHLRTLWPSETSAAFRYPTAVSLV